MNGMPVPSAAVWRSSNSCGWSVEPRSSPGRCRTLRAQLLLVGARRVGGERDVDRDGEVGSERVRRGARAGEGDLLLRRRPRRDVAGRAAGLGDEPRRLVGDVAPRRLSIERDTTQPFGTRAARRRSPRHSPIPHPRARLLAVPRRRCRCAAERSSGTCLRSSSPQQVVASSDHAGDGRRRGDLHALAHEIIGSHPPTPLNHRKPSSSMWWTSGRSRRCGRSPRRRPPAVPFTRATMEPTVSYVDLGEGGGRLAEHGSGGLLVPEGPGAVRSLRT